jgi:hypothetical protein
VSEYDQTVSAASVFAGDTAADTSATNELLVATVASPWTTGHHVRHGAHSGVTEVPSLVNA